MKMNAKKLTLVLVALLLALTCVFAACNKDTNNETKPADGQQEQQTPAAETIANEDLTKVAEQFKADFEAKFLGLYSTEVAKTLRAAEDEALLKIVAAKDKAEAEKIAAEYIAKLEAAKTLADEVKDLVAKIGDVALADEADIKLMLDYDATLSNELTAGATGAKKAVLDAYKADAKTQEAVAAIPARLAVLKAADAAANKVAEKAEDCGINVKIAAMLAKFQAEDAKLDLGDYRDYLALEEEVAAFVEEYELDENSDAFKEVVKAPDLKTAKDVFDEKTKDNAQIQRAIDVVDTSKELVVAAAAAKNTNYIWVDADDLFYWDTTIYWMDQTTFARGALNKTLAEGKTLKLVAYTGAVTFDGSEDERLVDTTPANENDVLFRFVNPDDTFATAQAANDKDLHFIYWCRAPKSEDHTYLIYVDGTTAAYAKENRTWMTKAAAIEAGVENPIKVVDPNQPDSYKLSLQPVIEKAAEVADAWKPYIPQEGTQDYRENIVLVGYYQTITSLIKKYNSSLKAAIDEYDALKANIVEMNYVDTIPEKDDSTGTYVIEGIDTQKEKNYNGSKRVWKELLYEEIEKIIRTARTPIESQNKETYIRTLFKEGAYPFTAWFFTTADFPYRGNDLKFYSAVDLVDGKLALTYMAFSYRWKVATTDRKSTEEVTAYAFDPETHEGNEGNTVDLDKYLDLLYYGVEYDPTYDIEVAEALAAKAHSQVDYRELLKDSEAFLVWVERYIGEDLPDTFDLDPYEVVAFESGTNTDRAKYINYTTGNPIKVLPDTEIPALGTDVLTFVDDKLEEVADPQIYMIKGEKVDAEPTEALDITVFADYNVAKTVVAYNDAKKAAIQTALEDLDDATMGIFRISETNAIDEAALAYRWAHLFLIFDATRVNGYPNNAANAKPKIDAWGKKNSIFYDQTHDFGSIIAKAIELQGDAKGLYPTDKWIAALNAAYENVAAAEKALNKVELYLAAYEKVLADAQKELDYKEAGYAIGWTTTKTDENGFASIPKDDTRKDHFYTEVDEGTGENVAKWNEIMDYRLIATLGWTTKEETLDDNATRTNIIEQARARVYALTEWKNIFEFAAKFKSDNDSYRADPVTPNLYKNAAWLDSSLTATELKAKFAEYIGTYLKNYPKNTHGDIYERTNVYKDNIIEFEFEDELCKVTVDELAQLMADIFVEADANVKYRWENILGEPVVVYEDADGNVKEAKFDKNGWEKQLKAAKEEYDLKLAKFLETFKIEGEASYDQLATIDAQIQNIYDFLKDVRVGKTTNSKGREVAVHPDYINLKWNNKYTGECVDVFSELFNARIMATYYKSVKLTLDYALYLDSIHVDENGDPDPLASTDPKSAYYKLTHIDPLDDDHKTSWAAYAYNYVADKATSTATFKTFEEAVDALYDTYVYVAADGIDYDWAARLMGLKTPDELNAFDDYLAKAAYAVAFSFVNFVTVD